MNFDNHQLSLPDMSQPQLPASHRYKRWPCGECYRVPNYLWMCISLPKTLTKLQKATCSKWSERLHRDKKCGESRYKEDTAGGNATLATPCHHSTFRQRCSLSAGPGNSSRTTSRCCSWAPGRSHSPYIYAPWANQMDAVHSPKRNCVEILALLQDAFSALLS